MNATMLFRYLGRGAVIAFCGMLTVIVLQCTDMPLSGGFGSETTNGGVSGTALLPDGSPSVGARVSVRRADYVNDSFPAGVVSKIRSGEDAVTDSTGAFSVTSLDTGSYVVEINDGRANAVMRSCALSADREMVDLEQSILQPFVTVEGWVDPSLLRGDAYVQVVGLDRLVPVGQDGRYVLDDLPYGTVQLRVVTAGAVADPVETPSVSTEAGRTTVVPLPGWNHARKVVLNTTASGAGVYRESVTGFPVLVRLDESIFDFSDAAPDGEDCMFTKPGGEVLPFDIERWDAPAGKAELWVLVDTVYPNDSMQYFVFHYGNGDVSGEPVAAPVFDSAAGYFGVWHLHGDGRDATQRGNDADVCTPADAEGVIGGAKRFNGADSIRIASLFGEPQTVTLSAWARLDSVPSGAGGAEVVSIGDGCLLRMDDTEDRFGVAGSFHLSGESVFYHVSSGQFLSTTGWHHLVVVFDNTMHAHALYIDGELGALQNSTDPVNYEEMGENTFIGVHGNGKTNYNFRGMIDEVRISNAVPSKERVRLEYMNQKPDNALVHVPE
jgi:hypothetical protein